MTERGRKRGVTFFDESHGKQHGERKVERINPLTIQRNADPGPGHMNPTVQRPGSNSSIGELLLLIYKGGFYRGE